MLLIPIYRHFLSTLKLSFGYKAMALIYLINEWPYKRGIRVHPHAFDHVYINLCDEVSNYCPFQRMDGRI